MNFAYDNLSYATSQETHGANNFQSQPVFYATNDSNQPKVLIDSNYTQYSPSSSSPPTPDNKENKIQGNSSDKMSSKKPLWAPGKPLSPKAQEMIKMLKEKTEVSTANQLLYRNTTNISSTMKQSMKANPYSRKS